MDIKTALKKANDSIRPMINDVLEDVGLMIKITEQQVIDEVVYEAYSPVKYERRYDEGGLGDINNIKVKVNNGTITVTNITRPNPYQAKSVNKNLPALIEYGHGVVFNYDYPRRNREYMKPRPFTRKTIERLEATGDHITALKQGLRDKGLKVK